VGELSGSGHSRSDEVCVEPGGLAQLACVEPGGLAQLACVEPSFERAFESAVIGKHHCSSILHGEVSIRASSLCEFCGLEKGIESLAWQHRH
jgi:hypothetical protein